MVDTHTSLEMILFPLPQVADLTFREWEVLLLISEDKSNDEIAVLSNLKTDSVRSMRNRIGDKLILKGHHKLGHFARQHRQVLHELFPLMYPPRKAGAGKSSNNK